MKNLKSSTLQKRLNNAVILVVDDTETNRALLTRSLSSRGYSRVYSAKDGAEAYQMTHDLKPDIVILDLVMPGMDGFSYCQAIRRNPAFNNMPIVVQTMLEDMEDKLKAFSLGASDYVCKPTDPDELYARTQVHLTKKLLIEDLNQYQEQINAEMQAARAMQMRLMPDEAMIAMCERIFDLKIAVHFETSSTLGGDCWGLRPISEKKLAIYNYDFSGHGISAALNVFRIHTIMQECLHAGGDPGSYLGQLNQRLHPLLERNEFATMFYGVIDTDSNCLLYATAATCAPVLYSAKDKNCSLLSGQGFPLGAIKNGHYETKYAPFLPEDLLLSFSDCMVESKNADDAKNGLFLCEDDIMGRVVQSMNAAREHPAQAVLNDALALFREHQQGPLSDDLTINAFWRNKGFKVQP